MIFIHSIKHQKIEFWKEGNVPTPKCPSDDSQVNVGLTENSFDQLRIKVNLIRDAHCWNPLQVTEKATEMNQITFKIKG